jgi:hypothetical protein
VGLLVGRLRAAEKELQQLRDLTPNNDPYFISLGDGDDVPPYLHTPKRHTQIRNRRFAKRDVEVIIKKIWKKKAFSDEQMRRKVIIFHDQTTHRASELTEIPLHVCPFDRRS